MTDTATSGRDAGGFAWAVLFLAIFAFAAAIRISSPDVAVRSPDEKYYAYYAQYCATDPLHGPARFVAIYNANSAEWQYPIPLRIGYNYLIAAVMKVTGLAAIPAGVRLSIAASILQFAFAGLIGLRFFNRWAVLAALVLLSVSPLDLAVARRVWGDGVNGCAATIFLWIAAELTMRKRKLGWSIGLWLLAVFFMLLKETAVFFVGFTVLGLATDSWLKTRSWKRPALYLAGAGTAGLCGFCLLITFCGGLPAVMETMRADFETIPHNLYGLSHQQGPWYSLPAGLFVLSPITAIGAAAGMFLVVFRGSSVAEHLSMTQQQVWIARGIAGLIILVLAAATLPAALKNLRYTTLIIAPWYLMAGLGLSYAARLLQDIFSPRISVPVMAGCLLLLGFAWWSDYARYMDLVVRREIPDLDIRRVMEAPFTKNFD